MLHATCALYGSRKKGGVRGGGGGGGAGEGEVEEVRGAHLPEGKWSMSLGSCPLRVPGRGGM